MFTIEKLQFRKQAGESESSINLEARRECEDIMKKIYDEDPSYWPYGLNMSSHDGGVYMIREASTKKPIGFTGWQERMDGDTKVGFYSIGILPEYRNNGYAKQAVAKLIAIKSANVDRVQALVMKHNKPSLALADALHIPVVKCGSEKRANKLGVKDILKMIGFGGVPAAIGMDALTYGRDKTFEEYTNTPFTANRAVQALANVLFGGLAAKPGLNMIERAGVLAGIPAKDVAISAIPAVPSLTESIKSISEKQPSKSFSDLIAGLSPTEKAVGVGLGAAGLLGAGYLGSKALGSLKDISEAQQQSARGRIRVALPTKDPNDQETIIEMPIEDLEVSRTQFEKLQRDLRRRIRKETKERTAQKTLGSFMAPKEAKAKRANLNNVNYLLNILHG